MEKEVAIKFVEDCSKKDYLTLDEEKSYFKNLEFLVEETADPKYQALLGRYYYDKKEFELALQYYLMAAEANNQEAVCELANIYFYGLSGETDYKLALYYYKRAQAMGNDPATIAVSDMYAKGLGTAKDPDEALRILTELYEKTKNSELIYSIYPETVVRLASYWIKDKKIDEALEALKRAKDFIKSRLVYKSSFVDFDVMERIIDKIYKCIKFDKSNMDIYDIIYYFKKEGHVSFTFNNDRYYANGELDNNKIAIEFKGKWYDDVRSFILNAKINNERIASLAYFISDVKGE